MNPGTRDIPDQHLINVATLVFIDYIIILYDVLLLVQ